MECCKRFAGTSSHHRSASGQPMKHSVSRQAIITQLVNDSGMHSRLQPIGR